MGKRKGFLEFGPVTSEYENPLRPPTGMCTMPVYLFYCIRVARFPHNIHTRNAYVLFEVNRPLYSCPLFACAHRRLSYTQFKRIEYV